MRRVIRPVANLVHYGHVGIVHSVMTASCGLTRDCRALTIDEPALLHEAQAVTRRVWERTMRDNPDIPLPSGRPAAVGCFKLSIQHASKAPR